MPDFSLETVLKEKGYFNIAGSDETSRGSLIGSVFAGAVIITEDLLDVFEKTLNDSKKLSEKKRRELSDLIKATCSWSIGTASVEEIDEINILNATKLAMSRAIDQLAVVDYVLVDGNMHMGDILDIPYESIVKGDVKCLSIAAASIIAKEAQCQYMYDLDKIYPQYGLAKHKGYGTAFHLKAIAEYGPCDIHRKTFGGVREFING